MLTYITIGTNDLQRAAAFYDAIFNVLGYSRLPAWTEDWAMWGDENNPDEGLASVFVLRLTDNPQRRETGQCSHSVQLTRS
jgi:catechol 2,3-dioxygenase-like lactoylglutathione lyase family enzyme